MNEWNELCSSSKCQSFCGINGLKCWSMYLGVNGFLLWGDLQPDLDQGIIKRLLAPKKSKKVVPGAQTQKCSIGFRPDECGYSAMVSIPLASRDCLQATRLGYVVHHMEPGSRGANVCCDNGSQDRWTQIANSRQGACWVLHIHLAIPFFRPSLTNHKTSYRFINLVLSLKSTPVAHLLILMVTFWRVLQCWVVNTRTTTRIVFWLLGPNIKETKP